MNYFLLLFKWNSLLMWSPSSMVLSCLQFLLCCLGSTMFFSHLCFAWDKLRRCAFKSIEYDEIFRERGNRKGKLNKRYLFLLQQKSQFLDFFFFLYFFNLPELQLWSYVTKASRAQMEDDAQIYELRWMAEISFRVQTVLGYQIVPQ